jgi:hypothetical protein
MPVDGRVAEWFKAAVLKFGNQGFALYFRVTLGLVLSAKSSAELPLRPSSADPLWAAG